MVFNLFSSYLLGVARGMSSNRSLGCLQNLTAATTYFKRAETLFEEGLDLRDSVLTPKVMF